MVTAASLLDAGISLISPEPTGRGGGARCTPHISLNARAITLAALLVMLALSVPPLSERNVPADAGAGSNSRNSARTMRAMRSFPPAWRWGGDGVSRTTQVWGPVPVLGHDESMYLFTVACGRWIVINNATAQHQKCGEHVLASCCSPAALCLWAVL